MSSGFRGICLALLFAAIAGCGGGGGGSFADTGIGGSGGAARGPIQGFGSIIVNDLTLNVDAASFEIEGEPAGTGTAGQSQLREGQVIVAYGDIDGREAETVSYRSDVRGPLVGAPVILDLLTGRGTLNVLGQTVITNSATIYSNGAALDTLADTNQVEVSGNRDASGNLVASFIELETGLTEYKVVGVVSSANTAAKTFRLDGLEVDYASATLRDLDGDPADGMTVEVQLEPNGFTAPDAAVATRVEMLGASDFDEGTELDYEGLIDRFASDIDFDVSGQRVITTMVTTYENGTADSLGLNVKVKVKGIIDGAGMLVADTIAIEPTEAVRAESTVSGVDPVAGTLSVSVGLTFTVRSSTEIEDEMDGGEGGDLTLDGLQTGDYVEVRGYLDGSTLVAAEIERTSFNSRFALRAPVRSEDPPTGTLNLLGVAVRGEEPQTTFQDASGQSVSQTEFFERVTFGTFVEARWDPFVSTSDIATRLSIEVESED
jgi:hypothetical protein